MDKKNSLRQSFSGEFQNPPHLGVPGVVIHHQQHPLDGSNNFLLFNGHDQFYMLKFQIRTFCTMSAPHPHDFHIKGKYFFLIILTSWGKGVNRPLMLLL